VCFLVQPKDNVGLDIPAYLPQSGAPVQRKVAL
jgi:hypothetical protein